MTRTLRLTMATLLACAGPAFAAPPVKAPPTAPPEITAAAPSGTTLLSFTSSGDQPDAAAAAVYETPPDKNGIRHRTLTVFGRNGGQFAAEFSNEKLIACSKCSQFHDDPFDGDYVKVTPAHVHIEQIDSGEKPSTTVLDFVKKADTWQVSTAERETVVAGRGDARTEKLPFPTPNLASDMDARWAVPVFLNGLVVNRTNGKFMFTHGKPTPDSVWAALTGDCNKQECTVLVQQEDGCISLVRDAGGRSFGGGSPDPKDKVQAISRAMSACDAGGGQACKEVRTDCSKGI